MNQEAGKEYAHDLGALLGNLQMVEYLLRTYLYEPEPSSFVKLADDLDWYGIRPGDELPLNALTSYETLGQLIERYNQTVGSAYPENTVDPALVWLRDALAHGRVSLPPESTRPVLLKFDRPTASRVKVTVAETLTPDWLMGQRLRVLREGDKVHRRLLEDR